MLGRISAGTDEALREMMPLAEGRSYKINRGMGPSLGAMSPIGSKGSKRSFIISVMRLMKVGRGVSSFPKELKGPGFLYRGSLSFKRCTPAPRWVYERGGSVVGGALTCRPCKDRSTFYSNLLEVGLVEEVSITNGC
jgi:hypothetical protein